MSIDITSFNALSAIINAPVTSVQEKTSNTDFSDILKASSSGKTDLDAIFESAALKYNVPVDLLKAVAKAESNFRPDATSKCGAMGIMQLMPGTARSLGVTDAYDPEQNIMGGAKYLSQMLDKFDGDVKLALAAYNAGPGAVTKYGGIPPYSETQNYVKKVVDYMGGNLSAGYVTYASGSSSGGIRDVAEYADNARTRDALTEALMMKIMEMQMKSKDDDDKTPF